VDDIQDVGDIQVVDDIQDVGDIQSVGDQNTDTCTKYRNSCSNSDQSTV
jgi:hypothetical protein